MSSPHHLPYLLLLLLLLLPLLLPRREQRRQSDALEYPPRHKEFGHVHLPSKGVVAAIRHATGINSMPEACPICPQGCSTIDGSPNGICPKYWQRPEGSSLCSQSWNCAQYSNDIARVIGSFFLLLAFVYLRIIYFNYTGNSTEGESTSATKSTVSRIRSFWKNVSPQNFAR
jgi:hypothetical protein